MTSIAFAPDGRTLYSASYDATIRAWDVRTGKEMRRFAGGQGMVLSIACPDEKILAQVESICRSQGGRIHRQR